MKLIRSVLALCALTLAVPAFGQSTYTTPAGTRVNGVVNLQCDTNGANCAPSGSTGASGYADNVSIVQGSTQAQVVAVAGDAGSYTNGLVTNNRNLVYNGSNWDRMRGDVNGSVVQPALSSTFWNYAAAAGGITNTTTAVTVKAAAGASVRNYVASMQCTSDALNTATELAIRDGAAGTVMWRGKINTGGWLDGSEITFSPALKGTANTLVEIVTLTASGTGSVYCNLQGYTGS